MSVDTTQSRSIACCQFVVQMTRVHPTPVSATRVPRQVLCLRPGGMLLFFQPGGDCVASHTEGTADATDARTLLVGSQDHLALLGSVALWLWVGTATATTVIATIALFAVGGLAIANQLMALAVRALQCDCYHNSNI